MNKETSSRVSTIAAKIMRAKPRNMGNTEDQHFNELLEDAKTLAGSCMSQDETPGRAPETFIDRLQRERDDLDDRLGKLVDFLNKGAPGATPRHIQMLGEQNRCMSEYLEILDERLSDLKISERSTATAMKDGKILSDDERGAFEDEDDGA